MRLMRVMFPLLVIAIGLGCSSSGQINETNARARAGTGFIYERLEGHNGRQFAVFVPLSYSPQKKYPAIVFLHGRFEAGSDGRACTTVGIGPEAARNADNFPFIVVFPQTNGGWDNAEDEKIAITALEQAKRKYSIDPNRVILTGLSTGGYGTWRIGAKYRDRFAALVPTCGYSFYEGVSMLTATPVWCWHYSLDWAVSSGGSREMVKRINAAGGHARLSSPGGLGHDVWTVAYRDPELYRWMLAQKRK
jgi:predicted peptidase